MKIVLKPGEKINICFAESDGKITIAFNKDSITVNSNLPDTQRRQGCIYQEDYGNDNAVSIEEEIRAKIRARYKRDR